ncbi:hypothetical protein N7466_010228 [Penicillium verhagenii]|uniref:uncharacterized protein n=1 Tax=Penicillium verhagenii TaxID=1562060 RepID=UPI0025458B50|nr:uncharacterized protein N7466_010228 [Penicillium verhagenii]KAJ5919285.1 hypothetical protein N7466_010228 [Penicillium verhagenii]
MLSFAKRVYVEVTASTTTAEQNEMNRDSFRKAGKYGYGFIYFAVVLLVTTTLIRLYHGYSDKIRIILYKESGPQTFYGSSTPDEYELPSAGTDASSMQFFPPTTRYVPPETRIPPSKIYSLEQVAFLFVALYCFVPQPFYYWYISLGSPPLAIRAGMLAVAMVPWIVALATKANIISMMTGLGHERLNGLHRWLSYICLFCCLVHMVPFYITPVWTGNALVNYRNWIPAGIYAYGNGWAALAPMLVLCVHSLPFIRHRMYELFIFVHIPVSWIFVAMMFWHTKNYLKSWGYLWTTVAIWVVTYLVRLFYLNWSNPFRSSSFMIGEESAITLLPQNAVKVTIPTKMRWRAGQYVYLRMPSIGFIQSHPFTIASLCSEDFPSAYGEEYRDMTLVFRPFQGFTRQVVQKALEFGPFKTYTAFLEGPYGGMQRDMAAFDDVVFFAGGSGITAIASQLLDLIKRIRDGKAVTRSIKVIWALRSAEMMGWFSEELRICRDSAPAGLVHCHFFLTEMQLADQAGRDLVQEKIYGMLQGIDKRNSAYIRQEADGDMEREKELRRENEDGLAALPGAYTAAHVPNTRHYFQPSLHISTGSSSGTSSPGFDFGFGNTTPVSLKQPAPRYASFQPSLRRDNWKTDYFRPDVAKMLNEFSQSFGRRACIFVCGPPGLRVDVSNAVAKLQLQVLTDSSKDEIFLHAENYNH